MQKHLDNVAYVIASLGLVGVVPAARVWGSLLGVVFLWLTTWLYGLSSIIGLSVMGGGLTFMLLVSWYVRRDIPEEKEADIVLDRLAGVAIALAWLPGPTLKYILFGFCLFHVWLFISVLAQRVYAYDNKTATGGVTLSTGEIVLIACMANAALRFLWWVAH